MIASGGALVACDQRDQKPQVDRAPLSVISPAAAQQVDRVVPPGALSGAMQPVDEAFALFATSSGLAEIEGARLLLKKSENRDVRDYAEKLVREHGRSAEALRRLVAPAGLTLPRLPTGRHADLVTTLSGVRAEDLDEAFLQRFGVDAHKEAIALYERHAAEGRDPALKQFAQRTLPQLRSHLELARKLLYAAAAR